MRIERLEATRFSLKPPIPSSVAYGSYLTLDYVLLQVGAGVLRLRASPALWARWGRAALPARQAGTFFAARKSLIAGEVIGPLFLEGDIATGFEVEDNRALVPTGPGLGVQL